jgi:hypothetical protein
MTRRAFIRGLAVLATFTVSAGRGRYPDKYRDNY